MNIEIGAGNPRNVITTIGGRNYAQNEREQNDYYATDPHAVELLLGLENFSNSILEPACGEGHISKVLVAKGMDVISTDLIDRGFGTGGVNFLTDYKPNSIDRDIITNPPFKYAQDFIEKSLDVVTDNHKVAMFLRLQFLEGKARRKLFQTYPPQFVYVSSSRLCCAMNGDFERYASSNAVCFCWFVWQKGYHGDTILRWFN